MFAQLFVCCRINFFLNKRLSNLLKIVCSRGQRSQRAKSIFVSFSAFPFLDHSFYEVLSFCKAINYIKFSVLVSKKRILFFLNFSDKSLLSVLLFDFTVE